jgi:hypothetical protein
MQQQNDPRVVNVLSYCQTLGAQNPRITHQQGQDVQTTLFVIEADAWAVPSQFGAGNERMFTLWMDGNGNGTIGEVGLTPR